MKSIARRWQELTVRNVVCLAGSVLAGMLAAGCASDPRPVVVGQSVALPALGDYCAVAQKEIASARLPAHNVVMTDYQVFARATPSIKPFETMQLVTYTDAQRTHARMISCKFHSVERIRAEYGATAAGEASTCARLNRRTLDGVMATLTERQKKKMPFKGPVPIMLEPDLVASSEADWLEAFTMVDTDAGGTLRIRAKSLGVSAGSVKTGAHGSPRGGVQYCHLIAPDYLKRILTGEVQLPKAEFPAAGQTARR